MRNGPLRWLVSNFRTLFLAFGLALVVWVSSVIAANPNEERTYSNVRLEVVGKGADMQITSDPPATVSVTLFAPRSYLDRYQSEPDLLRATLDLSGLGSGVHEVPVQVSAELEPTRIERVSPEVVEVSLDRLITQEKPVQVEIVGNPARGYQAGDPELETLVGTVTGPESQVAQVAALVARLSIENADEPIQTDLQLRPFNEDGGLVADVQIAPATVQVTLPISLLPGSRNLVERVVTIGQVATGYRLTNLTPSPPNVIVSSPDPDLVNSLPGFVETEPLDLTGLTDDIEVRMPLNLPPGVSVSGEQNVLVQVGVAAIESSISIRLPVEIVGLGTGLSAQAAPDAVDVILTGPIVELDVLDPADVRVFVDVAGLEPDVYQLEPQVEILSESILVESILPEILEVIIAEGELPTRTPTAPSVTPGSPEALTPSPEATPTP
jgi:YbbR domain-containing protein